MTKSKDKLSAEVSTREISRSSGSGPAQHDHEEPPYTDDDDGGDTETTRLLGVVDDTHGSGSGGEGEHDGVNDDWVGMEDFKGLPWWKTPSVCCSYFALYCCCKLEAALPSMWKGCTEFLFVVQRYGKLTWF